MNKSYANHNFDDIYFSNSNYTLLKCDIRNRSISLTIWCLYFKDDWESLPNLVQTNEIYMIPVEAE